MHFFAMRDPKRKVFFGVILNLMQREQDFLFEWITLVTTKILIKFDTKAYDLQSLGLTRYGVTYNKVIIFKNNNKLKSKLTVI